MRRGLKIHPTRVLLEERGNGTGWSALFKGALHQPNALLKLFHWRHACGNAVQGCKARHQGEVSGTREHQTGIGAPLAVAMSSSATTKPVEQGKTTSILGGIMHEWRQWLAPGVVVTIVLATGALQRADMRTLSSKVDQVNARFDQVYQLLLP